MNNIWQSTLQNIHEARLSLLPKRREVIMQNHHAAKRKEANKTKILMSDLGDKDNVFTRQDIESLLCVSKGMANEYLREMLEDKQIVVHKPAGKITMAIYKFNNE